MLVLTRKPNQQIRIGDSITISVVKVKGNTIRLGIEAPKDVRVMRSEVCDTSTLAEPSILPIANSELNRLVDK